MKFQVFLVVALVVFNKFVSINSASLKVNGAVFDVEDQTENDSVDERVKSAEKVLLPKVIDNPITIHQRRSVSDEKIESSLSEENTLIKNLVEKEALLQQEIADDDETAEVTLQEDNTKALFSEEDVSEDADTDHQANAESDVVVTSEDDDEPDEEATLEEEDEPDDEPDEVTLEEEDEPDDEPDDEVTLEEDESDEDEPDEDETEDEPEATQEENELAENELDDDEPDEATLEEDESEDEPEATLEENKPDELEAILQELDELGEDEPDAMLQDDDLDDNEDEPQAALEEDESTEIEEISEEEEPENSDESAEGREDGEVLAESYEELLDEPDANELDKYEVELEAAEHDGPSAINEKINPAHLEWRRRFRRPRFRRPRLRRPRLRRPRFRKIIRRIRPKIHRRFRPKLHKISRRIRPKIVQIRPNILRRFPHKIRINRPRFRIKMPKIKIPKLRKFKLPNLGSKRLSKLRLKLRKFAKSKLVKRLLLTALKYKYPYLIPILNQAGLINSDQLPASGGSVKNYLLKQFIGRMLPSPSPQQGISYAKIYPHLLKLWQQRRANRNSYPPALYSPARHPWSGRIHHPNPQHPAMIPYHNLLYPTLSPSRLRSYPVQPLQNTNFGRSFKRSCPGNRQALYLIKSWHSNRYQDRRWEFSCKTVVDIDFSHCFWTSYQNYFKMPLIAHCPSNYVMNGIQSYFRKTSYDRRFKLRCCHAPSYKTKSCSLSGFINKWDRKMGYSVPGSRVFTGMYSFHNNSRKDRRWKFANCDYSK